MKGLAVLTALALSSCTAGSSDDVPTVAGLPDEVSCTVAYRSAVTESIEHTEEVTLGPGQSEAVDLEEVTVTFVYSFSESEGAGVRIDARAPDSDAPFSRVLYQFMEDEPPRGDLFAGGHGFTGLSYVYPPGTTVEAQFFCRASAVD